MPFTDKGIQACRLKGSTPALGQSAVRRHTRTLTVDIVIAIAVNNDANVNADDNKEEEGPPPTKKVMTN